MATPTFDHAHTNIFQSTFNFYELDQYAKNQAFSLFCSRDIVDLKIQQSDWSRAFWPISQELDFSQAWDLCKNTENIIKFLYRPNSENIND